MKKSACTGVRVLITMLPACAHVRDVYCGEDGILSADGTLATLSQTLMQHNSGAHTMTFCL